jgi:hypothetical protein
LQCPKSLRTISESGLRRSNIQGKHSFKHSRTNEKWTVVDRSTDEILNGAVEAGGEGDKREFYMGNIFKLNFDGEGAGYFEEGTKWLEGAVKRQSLKEIVERSISRLNW